MALHYVIELPVVIFQTLFCVDSKSVLQSLQHSNSISSNTIINEILHLIHILICKGTEVTFCWVPSHCGIYGNELADRFAKRAAKNENVTEVLNIPLTLNEAFCVLKRVAWGRFEDKQKQSKSLVKCKSHFFSFDDIQKSQFLNLTDTYKFKHFQSVFYRLKLNAFKTKYISTVRCLCGHTISSAHLLFECLPLKHFLPSFSENSLDKVFSNSELALRLTAHLLASPIGSYL